MKHRPARPRATSRLVGLALCLAVAGLTFGCASGAPSVERSLREADRALAAGDATAAQARYDAALAAAPEGSAAHRSALYGAAMTRLAEGVETAEAAAMLDRLSAYPGLAEDWAAAKAARRAWQEIVSLEAERARLDAEVAACHATAGEASAAAEAGAAVVDDETEVLRARLRRTEVELAAAKSELAKTEEALRKIKETLVGGGGR